MHKKIFLLGLLLMAKLQLNAQTAPFDIVIEPMSISGISGLQAYSFGQDKGKWLIVGGRLDGLHRRQPFAAFDVAGNNNQIVVVDPIARQKWIAPLSTLSTALQEHLSATNAEFYQQGQYLYILGGYGYNAASASKKTFDFLTAIDVPALIDAVISGASISAYFRQISDPQFAVTGGQLKKINNTFYLIGGNKFDGNYNPVGNPTYTQVYTNAIRKFNLTDDGTTILINHLASIVDTINLHRRDYNALPQILPDGTEGITAFSGVFQRGANLPYLNCVMIDSIGYTVPTGFQQYYNHYHCAVLPIFSDKNKSMHNVFFGGIAQYYDSAGVLVQDNNVPFVRTIARVSRDATGALSEYKLPIEMPSLLGSGAEFIPLMNVPHYPNKVFKLDEFEDDTTLVGHIYGGISSTAPNIFMTNTGVESSASSQIFKVYVIKNSKAGIHTLNKQSVGSLKIQVFPNPNNGAFLVKFFIKESTRLKIQLFDAGGKLLEEETLQNINVGEHSFEKSVAQLERGGTYFLRVETAYESISQKVIIKR